MIIDYDIQFLARESFHELSHQEIEKIKNGIKAPDLSTRYRTIQEVYILAYSNAIQKIKEVNKCNRKSKTKQQ